MAAARGTGVDAQVGAALTVYAQEADAFDEEVRRTARRLAPHVRSAIAGSEAQHRARAMADEMEAELEARAVIGEATGILVHRYRLTPERAVELMARLSARSQLDLRQIADGVVRMTRASRG
jgi:AmiR/NasT family two-component response regulator